MSISSNMQQEKAHEFERAKKILQLKQLPPPKPESFIHIPESGNYTEKGRRERLECLTKDLQKNVDHLSGSKHFDDPGLLKGNIEHFIGMAQIPVGIAGPMLVNGTEASGAYYVPLATTEGALVASYARGMRACRESGYITSVCLIESVQRSPIFRFNSITDMGQFAIWIMDKLPVFTELVKKVTRHGMLKDMSLNLEGNNLTVTFEYFTGDAAGQNMVTICTDHICHFIVEQAPVKPKQWFLESNYSGDKKATALSFTNVRGKKVTAEIVLPKEIVHKVLKSTPALMTDYWRTSTISVVQSGAIGAQGHIANGIAAIFIACGQDVACVSEASIGITRMELTENNDLYATVTLPGLIVGTVGGGTSLPTQRECLELLDCFGSGKARKFAEICGAMILAGEISIAAALASGHFSQAHAIFGRKNT
ncbi:MAG: hydroxymethylglutaryl-CoA reductase [Chitinophagales bacterium]